MTTAQWSVISSAAVAIAAVLSTVWVAFADRRERRKAARIERLQPRLERTYLELVGYVYRRRMEANAIRPLMPLEGQQQLPEPVTSAEIERVQSLFVTIASEEVHAILEEFQKVVASIMSADAAMRGMETTREQTGRVDPPEVWGGSWTDYQNRIHTDQHRLSEIEGRMHRQVRRELREE